MIEKLGFVDMLAPEQKLLFRQWLLGFLPFIEHFGRWWCRCFEVSVLDISEVVSCMDSQRLGAIRRFCMTSFEGKGIF